MDHGEIVINIEKMLDDIVSNKVQVKDLNSAELEAVMDYIREVFNDMLGTENEVFAQGMIELLDTIHNIIENRSVADASNWDDDILASIERGNTYFEMQEYVIQ